MLARCVIVVLILAPISQTFAFSAVSRVISQIKPAKAQDTNILIDGLFADFAAARQDQAVISAELMQAVSLSEAQKSEVEGNATTTNDTAESMSMLSLSESRVNATISKNLAQSKSMMSLVSDQIEYELNMQEPLPVGNKLALSIIEALGLGLFGIDRCIMGQTCLGVVKGLTLGAFGLWALVDYIGILINCLGSREVMKSTGYTASWRPEDIVPAYWIMLVSLLLVLTSACFKVAKNRTQPPNPMTLTEAAPKLK